jgi:hypothetical protein
MGIRKQQITNDGLIRKNCEWTRMTNQQNNERGSKGDGNTNFGD